MDKLTDKEKWINEVMSSTEGMQKAEPNPFLYSKIAFRMQQKEKQQDRFNKVFIPRWVAVVILLVLVNCFSIIKMLNRQQQQHAGANTHLLSEFNTETTYNY